jgi:transposase
MSLGRPLSALILTPEERGELAGFAASRSLPHALVSRAQLVLWAAEGLSNQAIGERLGWSKPTVGKWRQRFVEYRLQGIYDELRPGRPRSISDEQVSAAAPHAQARAPRSHPLERAAQQQKRKRTPSLSITHNSSLDSGCLPQECHY